MSNWLAIWGLKDVLLINNLLYTFHSKIDLIFLSDMGFQTSHSCSVQFHYLVKPLAIFLEKNISPCHTVLNKILE